MNFQENNFFRAVLNSSKEGSVKTFTINYRNNKQFIEGKKYFVIVENFTTPICEVLSPIPSPDAYIVPNLHIFISQTIKDSSLNISPGDTNNNLIYSETNLVSFPPFIQLPDILDDKVKYQFNYNMVDLTKGVVLELPTTFTIKLKYSIRFGGVDVPFFNWSDTEIKGFNLILRIYPLN